MNQFIKKDRIICGDNLEVLRTLPDEFVDLIYIDPPFFTHKNYEVIWNDGAEIRQFGDRWITENPNGSGRATKDINTYLNWMEPRIKELHRVLKKTGSFYLHCDWHADSYLRMICDQIFGYNNLINEVVWNYPQSIKASSRRFLSNHDVLFIYSKTKDYVFNPQVEPYTEKQLQRFKHSDEKGRFYYDTRRDKNNNKIKVKVYLKKTGTPIGSVWYFNRCQGNEHLGYPTQKPEALLERIIKASSNEGDLVLDAFAGCGTTIAVARRLNRCFIGIDVSPTACRLMARRVNFPVKDIEGIPLTAEEIANLSGYEFQNYIINLLSPTQRGIRIGNRGADGGIDGSFFSLPISVKKYKAGRNDLDTFVAALHRQKKKEGMFLALNFSTDFRKEVTRLLRDDKITIYFYTIEDVLAKRHKDLFLKYDRTLNGFRDRESKRNKKKLEENETDKDDDSIENQNETINQEIGETIDNDD